MFEFCAVSFQADIGFMQAYASEVCRKEHQALGLSLVIFF